MTTTYNNSLYGSYRIDNEYFPAPTSSEWDEQEIAPGLNGVPINGSYRLHRWIYDELEGSFAERIYSKYAEQQSSNDQLDILETDPYDASLADEKYGTITYTDFVIRSVATRRRGLPNYTDVTVEFEVYIL